MYCRICGSNISDDSCFCEKCGTKVETVDCNNAHNNRQDDRRSSESKKSFFSGLKNHFNSSSHSSGNQPINSLEEIEQAITSVDKHPTNQQNLTNLINVVSLISAKEVNSETKRLCYKKAEDILRRYVSNMEAQDLFSDSNMLKTYQSTLSVILNFYANELTSSEEPDENAINEACPIYEEALALSKYSPNVLLTTKQNYSILLHKKSILEFNKEAYIDCIYDALDSKTLWPENRYADAYMSKGLEKYISDKLNEANPVEFYLEKLKLIDDIKEKGFLPDNELIKSTYAIINNRIGLSYLVTLKNPEKALPFYEKAHEYWPDQETITSNLNDCKNQLNHKNG